MPSRTRRRPNGRCSKSKIAAFRKPTAQEPVPRQHVARAPHAAQRDHRIRRADARRASSGRCSPKHKECLGDILTSARHLLQLINDMLDLAKVEAGRMEFQARAVELEKVVGEVRDILRSLAPSKRIRIAVDIEPRHRYGDGRSGPAQAGALQLSLERAQVHARGRPHRGALRRAGRGAFPSRGRGQGHRDSRGGPCRGCSSSSSSSTTSTAKRHAGTGLGLALTKRIVEAQGGAVGVGSAPGKGSTF